MFPETPSAGLQIRVMYLDTMKYIWVLCLRICLQACAFISLSITQTHGGGVTREKEGGSMSMSCFVLWQAEQLGTITSVFWQLAICWITCVSVFRSAHWEKGAKPVNNELSVSLPVDRSENLPWPAGFLFTTSDIGILYTWGKYPITLPQRKGFVRVMQWMCLLGGRDYWKGMP